MTRRRAGAAQGGEVSSTAGEPCPDPPGHNGLEMGRAAHRVIGRMLKAGVCEPSPEQILSFAAQEPLLHERHVYRLAARQRLIAATAIYWRFFLPPLASWTLIDYAVRLPDCDLDLVFRHQGGAVRSDELKTGGAPSLAEREVLEERLELQLAGCREKYGTKFEGVRVLFLGAPRRSFFQPVTGGDRVAVLQEGLSDPAAA